MLLLRDWALRVLAAAPGSRRGSSPPDARSAPPEAWDTLLLVERCALPLSGRLAAAGTLEQLSPASRAVLRRHATAEIQRAIGVRMQLTEIAEATAACGQRAVVLKGGVAAADGGEPLDLGDIDLLIPPPHSPAALAAELDRRGYCAEGLDGARHLAPRVAPDRLPVELHHTTAWSGADDSAELFRDLRPLGDTGLWRLSPANHLWQLLVHAVSDHPHRRGSLRDLLLLARAIAEAGAEGGPSADDPAAVAALTDARIAAHPMRTELSAQLGMARAIAAGQQPGDAFRQVAAANYLLYALSGQGLLPEPLALSIGHSVGALLGGRPAMRQLWQGAWSTVPAPALPLLPGMERRFPRAARAARVSLRLARLAAAHVAALPVAINALLL